MGWLEFLIAFGVFLFGHSLPLRPPVKSRLVARLGARAFMILYSALSLGALIWLISAAGRAPYVPLWDWAPWQSYVPLVAMLIVCLILALAIGRPNPFSFGGSRNDQFDPTAPGIVGYVRHPMLVAIGLWSAAHIVPNGNLAHVALFGSFAAFAILGTRIIDRRKQRLMGVQAWSDLKSRVTRPAMALSMGIAGRVVAGVVLYVVLVALHPLVIGVSPLP